MKVSTQIVLFIIAFNAGAHGLQAAGVASHIGINAEVGSTDALESVKDKDEVDLGNARGATLFGMYNVLVSQIGQIWYSIAPGFAMLRIFLPDVWIDFVSVLSGLFVTIDLLAFARGVNL